MPAAGFTLTVTKRVESTEQVSPEMWQLSTERGEFDVEGNVLSPTRIIAIFRPTDAEGRYRQDVEEVRREMVDLPSANNPALHDFASVMRQALIKAVVPEVEPFIGLGVAGLSVEQAGPVLMGQYFTLVAGDAEFQEGGEE